MMPPKKTGADPLPEFPKVDIPKNLGPLPKLGVPKEPDFRPVPAPGKPADPPTKAPTAVPDPKLPPLPDVGPKGGAAVPDAAPAFPDPLIPPPSVPVVPDAKQPGTLPSLVLPPETPVAPAKGSMSRSSPLRTEPSVSVFPASGEVALNGYRTVGFYNHTDRDLNLTIEGRAVKLPAKTYLHAKLGPSFTWGVGDRPAARETVPENAAGLDVVFRD
jgi:hypothetical protein